MSVNAFKEFAILGVHARLNELDRERNELMDTIEQIKGIDVTPKTRKAAPQVRTVKTARAKNGEEQAEANRAAGRKRYWASMTPKQRRKEVARRLGRA